MKNTILKFLLLSSLLLNTNFSFAQGWEKTFINDQGYAKGFDVVETQDGGYVMVGEIDLPTGAPRHHIWVVKTDQDGNELWSNIYGYYNISYSTARGVVETLEGDLLIAGTDLLNKASVFKISADGDSLWTKHFGGNGKNAFNDIAKSTDGIFILVGEYEAEANSDMHQPWAMGMTADGDSLWAEKYFTPSASENTVMDISPDSGGNFLLSGGSEGQGFSMLIDGASGAPYFENIHPLGNDGRLFTGTYQFGGNNKLFGGTSSGIAGYSPILIQTDTFGIFLNSIPLTTIGFGAITDMTRTFDPVSTLHNGFILTGSSYGFWGQSSSGPGFISKLDSDLEIEWEIVFEDSLNTEGTSIRQNADGTYLMTGSRQGGMFLKKIGDFTDAVHGIQAAGFEAKVYPNPASDQLYLEIPETIFQENLSISFYDATGRLIQQNDINNATETLNISNFSNGFYTYLLRQGTKELLSGKVLVGQKE